MKHWYVQFHNLQDHNVNISIVEFVDWNALVYFSEQAVKIYDTEVAATVKLLGLHFVYSVYCLLTLYSLHFLAPFVLEGCWT